jgi:hypothetical protein
MLILGVFLLIPMLGRKSDDRDSERVDVNDGVDSETNNTFEICYEGDPYDVVYYANVKAYNIGQIEGREFSPLLGSNGLRYAYNDKQTAIAKAKQLNDPQSGGVLFPETGDSNDSGGSDGLPPTELPPNVGGFGSVYDGGYYADALNEQATGWGF